MRNRITHIWLTLPLLIICIGFGMAQSPSSSSDSASMSAEILNDQTFYVAGDTITLRGAINAKETTNLLDVFLQLSSSYGVLVLSKNEKDNTLEFTVPAFISKKSGWVQWNFIVQGAILDTGSFEIIPNTSFNEIAESYIGPPSIVAGGKDFTMLVVAATDIYDNLLPNDTPVIINEQRRATKTSYALKIKNRIAWKRIFSPEKKGRLFATALIENSASKEMSIDIFANQPQNFTISYEQPHPFADGNQILTLSTSTLKDQYNNIITDGTLIQFTGVDRKEQVFRTSAITINGVATAKLLYPNHPTTWEIKAAVPGIATSPVITIDFESILNEFKLQFSNNNRSIKVGPLTSYLGQLIPDGAAVIVVITKEQESLEVSSKDGFAIFSIPEDYYPAGTYNFTITTLGISKRITKTIN
ncbi:MAG: hypothetical protein ACI825_000042 [Planctomycetota bacterium]|jgi:hypothetical protein